MSRGVNVRRTPPPALVGAAMLVIACGGGVDTRTVPPSTTVDPGGDTPAGAQTEAPGPWAPSRALALDRFALETALGSALLEPVGSEFSDRTAWTLGGENVELRLEVHTWFSAAEAQAACATAAGDGAETSLWLGTPTWATRDAVYVTQGPACVQVRVVRDGVVDADGAMRATAALVEAGS